jgi:alpha-amylase
VETGSEEGVTAFTMVNGSDGITAAFTFQQPAKVWFFPLMTVSMSEEGFERTYQGSSLLFLWPIQIEKEKAKRFSCQLLIQ